MTEKIPMMIMTLAMMVMMVILMRMMTKMTKKYKCNWFLVNSYQFWGLLKKGQKFGQWQWIFFYMTCSLMGEGLCGAPVTLLCISGHLRYDLWSTPRHGCCAGTRWMCEARPHGKVWLGQQRWCAVWIYKLVPRDAFPTPIKAALVSPHHCCCPHPSCII